MMSVKNMMSGVKNMMSGPNPGTQYERRKEAMLMKMLMRALSHIALGGIRMGASVKQLAASAL
jgi:hypothetical protein